MGTIIYYDENLPAVQPEAGTIPDATRQVEVLTTGGKLFIRISEIAGKDSERNRYTAELPAQDAIKLYEALDEAMFYLGYRR